ncbi:MAG TPA: hypothetical protein VFB60_02980, partial [Ktedonobacteraceae bacterium]|nr:hypothetical protein [Ktedonobacteraceae bacterium]
TNCTFLDTFWSHAENRAAIFPDFCGFIAHLWVILLQRTKITGMLSENDGEVEVLLLSFSVCSRFSLGGVRGSG